MQPAHLLNKLDSPYFDQLIDLVKQAHHEEMDQWSARIASLQLQLVDQPHHEVEQGTPCSHSALLKHDLSDDRKFPSSTLKYDSSDDRKFPSSTLKHDSSDGRKFPSGTLLINPMAEIVQAAADNSQSQAGRKFNVDRKSQGGRKSNVSRLSTATATATPMWLTRSVQKETERVCAGAASAEPCHYLTTALLDALGHGDSLFHPDILQTSSLSERALKGGLHWLRHMICKVVENARFDTFSIAVIVFNSAMIGWRTHELAGEPGAPASGVYKGLEQACSIWFLLEICFRFVASGSIRTFFCRSEKRWWNIFDASLSTIDVVTFILYFVFDVDQGDVSHLRLLRMMRIWRTFRIVRLFTIFQELRIMMLSLMACGRSLFWSLVMLCVIIYVFSVFFIQVTANDRDFSNGWDDSTLHNDIRKYCSSLPKLAYYLFQAMSGGISWGLISDQLIKVNYMNGVGMIFFIFFTMFAVLNIITGIFVHNSLRSAMNDNDQVIHEQLTADDSTLRRLREIFESARKEHPSLLSYSEFEEMVNDGRTRSLLNSVGLRTTKISGLFKLMDLDNSGFLSIDEFLLQCMRLRGDAKAVDLVTLMAENKRMMTVFQKVVDMLTDEAAELKTTQRLILLILQEVKHKQLGDNHAEQTPTNGNEELITDPSSRNSLFLPPRESCLSPAQVKSGISRELMPQHSNPSQFKRPQFEKMVVNREE